MKTRLKGIPKLHQKVSLSELLLKLHGLTIKLKLSIVHRVGHERLHQVEGMSKVVDRDCPFDPSRCVRELIKDALKFFDISIVQQDPRGLLHSIVCYHIFLFD
jgi:hypothetical protein